MPCYKLMDTVQSGNHRASTRDGNCTVVSDDSCHQLSNRLSQLHPPGKKRERTIKNQHNNNNLISFPGHFNSKEIGMGMRPSKRRGREQKHEVTVVRALIKEVRSESFDCPRNKASVRREPHAHTTAILRPKISCGKSLQGGAQMEGNNNRSSIQSHLGMIYNTM